MQKSNPKLSEKEKAVKSPGLRQAWRPISISRRESGGVCPHCGASVNSGDAICGRCGMTLVADKCSFCGAAIRPGSKFCTRCGQPRTGVPCPECGTLNSRNFCRHCNAPLTPMAVKAKEEAKRDQAFKAIMERAKELTELHARIAEYEATSGKTLSADDRKLLDEYAELLSSISAPVEAKAEVKPSDSSPAQAEKPSFTLNIMSIDEMMKAYREKAEEMNQALAEIAPPPEYTPEQQRDYYAARKIASFETEVELIGYSPMMWKCNFCGCLHETPPECTRPELGGTWIYVSPEQYLAEHPYLANKNIKLKIT